MDLIIVAILQPFFTAKIMTTREASAESESGLADTLPEAYGLASGFERGT